MDYALKLALLLCFLNYSAFGADAVDSSGNDELNQKINALEKTDRRMKICGAIVLAFVVGYGSFIGWSRGLLENPPKEFFNKLETERIPLPDHLQIYHLGQWHPPEIGAETVEVSEDQKMKILRSQAAIVSMLREDLRQNMKLYLFAEGQTERLDQATHSLLQKRIPPEKYSDEAFLSDISKELKGAVSIRNVRCFARVRREFPRGYPDPDGSGKVILSRNQASILLTYGAAEVLWALGDLDSILPTSNFAMDEKSLELYRELMQSDFLLFRPFTGPLKVWKQNRYIMTEREILALISIVKEFPKGIAKGQKIYLLFGDNHNFEKYKSTWLRIDHIPTLD